MDNTSLNKLERPGLHTRSKHNQSYNFEKLTKANPKLEKYVIITKTGKESILFSDPNSVKELNIALMKYHYQVNYWELPEKYLCPAIPGRAEYLHYLADLLGSSRAKPKFPQGQKVTILDVGTGSSLVYPLLGYKQYHWRFLATELNKGAFKSAVNILKQNEIPKSSIEVYHQPENKKLLQIY